MHIHGNSFNMQAAGLSAAQQLRAAESRRAADVRKKLLSAAGLEGGTDPEETVLIGQWLHHGQSQARDFAYGEDEYHTGPLDRDSDFR